MTRTALIALAALCSLAVAPESDAATKKKKINGMDREEYYRLAKKACAKKYGWVYKVELKKNKIICWT